MSLNAAVIFPSENYSGLLEHTDLPRVVTQVQLMFFSEMIQDNTYVYESDLSCLSADGLPVLFTRYDDSHPGDVKAVSLATVASPYTLHMFLVGLLFFM